MRQLFLFAFISLTSSLLTYGQNVNLSVISKALGEGNVTALENYLDNSVEIAILDSEDVYPKTEALKQLQRFFSQNKPQGFAQVHQGASKGKDSHYCIGNLSTANGNYRVYIFMKNAGGKYVVQELRFNKE